VGVNGVGKSTNLAKVGLGSLTSFALVDEMLSLSAHCTNPAKVGRELV
jgi:hypothetical protein